MAGFGQPDSGHQIKSSNNSFNFIEKIGVNYYVGGPVLYIPEPGKLNFIHLIQFMGKVMHLLILILLDGI